MPKCVRLIWKYRPLTKCTQAPQLPCSSLEFAVIIRFTLRVVLGPVQSFRNHSFTQVMAFTQSDFFIRKSRGRGFMKLVTCSASVTKAKQGSPGPKTGKASSQAQLHWLKACNRHYQRKEELSKRIKGGKIHAWVWENKDQRGEAIALVNHPKMWKHSDATLKFSGI